MDVTSQAPVTWEQVNAALDAASAAAEDLALTEPEKVQRRFGVVVARMELKRLFGIREEQGNV